VIIKPLAPKMRDYNLGVWINNAVCLPMLWRSEPIIRPQTIASTAYHIN